MASPSPGMSCSCVRSPLTLPFSRQERVDARGEVAVGEFRFGGRGHMPLIYCRSNSWPDSYNSIAPHIWVIAVSDAPSVKTSHR